MFVVVRHQAVEGEGQFVGRLVLKRTVDAETLAVREFYLVRKIMVHIDIAEQGDLARVDPRRAGPVIHATDT